MFPSFPNFAPLSLDDKDRYNELVARFPPFADLSFTNLHIWWNLGGKLAVCMLNANLIINYDLPFDKTNSGWGMVGDNKLDDTITELFRYLHQHNRPQRIVHVPEFMLEKLSSPMVLEITPETDFHEYVMSSEQLAKLEGKPHSRTRRKVNRFLREAEDQDITSQSLDLNDENNRKMIAESIKNWHEKYSTHNDPDRFEELALEKTLHHAPKLGTLNTCIFINGKLHGVSLYHPTPDGKHFIINHLKVDYHYPHIYDYLTQQVAQQALAKNVPYLNMEMDLGLEGLRHHKMGLRPVGFYKKFTLAPKN